MPPPAAVLANAVVNPVFKSISDCSIADEALKV
jgi:hypothetical protein